VVLAIIFTSPPSTKPLRIFKEKLENLTVNAYISINTAIIVGLETNRGTDDKRGDL
jgi:hypothetical protein